jgi:hypothetical protein
MDNVEQLVNRAVDGIVTIARRATGFAAWIFLGTLVVCVGGFVLGVAALSGGIETVWIVLAIFFGAIAIASSGVALWRVAAVRRHVPALTDEIRSLVGDGRDPSQRVVIESFVVDDGTGDGGRVGDPAAGSAVVLSRRLYGMRGSTAGATTGTVRLAAATKALTLMPVLLLVAVLISMVFAFSAFLFLIALALG